MYSIKSLTSSQCILGCAKTFHVLPVRPNAQISDVLIQNQKKGYKKNKEKKT